MQLVRLLIERIAAILRAIGRFLLAIAAPFVWIAQQLRRLVAGLLGPPWKALLAVLRSIAARIERVIDRLLDWWRRLWRRNPTSERVIEERKGTNGVLLLSAISLAVVWYWTPVARWMELGVVRYVLLGFVIWGVAVVTWLSRCRADRTGAVARFAQSVARSTGLRRFDQIGLVGALATAWLVGRQWQLLPLAWGAVLAYVGLLIQPHEPRPSLVVSPSAPVSPPPDPPAGATTPGVEGEHLVRQFTWQVVLDDRPRSHQATVVVQSEAVQAAREANSGRPSTNLEMVKWVTDHAGTAVESMARQIQQQCFESGYSLFTTVSCFVAACQAIPYSADLESTNNPEYWRYPVETIADGTGDCEDTSVLLAALLRRVGYRCSLFVFDDHVAVGVAVPDHLPGDHAVHDGVKYYYCETTAEGWHVGEVPLRYASRKFVVVDLPEWTSDQ